MSLRPLDLAHPTPFAQLMHLDQISPLTFRSTTAAYEPGGNVASAHGIVPRNYGGHVYAQATWAAAQTVPKGFVCHNVTGSFLRGGQGHVPFTYTVTALHDGKNFCVRSVDTSQNNAHGKLIFRATCSFKRPEMRRPLSLQRRRNLQREYASVLAGKQPTEHPDPPSADVPWFNASPHKYTGPPFPGLRSKMVDMAAFNRDRAYPARRQLHVYAVVGDMPAAEDEPNLHVAAHLYASDRNGLYIVSRLLGIQEQYGFTTSLTHAVTLHASPEALSVVDTQGRAKWFMQEMWSDRFEDSRGSHHSRMFGEDNVHIATTLQDGLFNLEYKDEGDYQATKVAMERNSRL